MNEIFCPWHIQYFVFLANNSEKNSKKAKTFGKRRFHRHFESSIVRWLQFFSLFSNINFFSLSFIQYSYCQSTLFRTRKYLKKMLKKTKAHLEYFHEKLFHRCYVLCHYFQSNRQIASDLNMHDLFIDYLFSLYFPALKCFWHYNWCSSI